MRVLLDSNVVFSGFGWPEGPPGKVIRAWQGEQFKLLVTTEIFTEYAEVLVELAHLNQKINYAETIALISEGAFWVLAAPLPMQICDDPDDDIFIAAALGGEADTIVTGDKALLRAHVPEVTILTPVAFLKTLNYAPIK